MEFKDLSKSNLIAFVCCDDEAIASEAFRALFKKPETSLADIQFVAQYCQNEKVMAMVQMAIINHPDIGALDVQGVVQFYGTSEEVRTKGREFLQSQESQFVLGLLKK